MGKDLKGKELGVGLSQRKDGRYSARFMRKSGKREEFYDFKLANVKKWLTDKKYEDEHGLYGDGSGITVKKWFDIWLETYKKDIVSHSTYKNYRTRFKINIEEDIGYMILKDVKKNHCQSILKKMHEEGYSYGTINQCKITLHALFDGAVSEEYIIKNPSQNIKCPQKETTSEERRVLSKEDQSVFLKYASSTFYYNAYLLILQTGLRIGELGGLFWEDIDFENKILHVRRTLLQNKEKGGFYFTNPKTQTSIRDIPLTDNAVSILKHQKIEIFKNRSLSKDWTDKEEFKDLVFCSHNGLPIGTASFRLNMIRIVDNINNDRKINCQLNNTKYEEFEHLYPHALRHTYATRCIENGMTPKVLQKILGHSTISVTMDLYVHVLDQTLSDETEKFSPQIEINIEKHDGVRMA